MKARVLIHPEEWRRRLLGLPMPEETKNRRGLLLLQLDGLSYPDLQRAIQKKYMPFLAYLIHRESYDLKPMYSGLPSNTPVFQGEFFFGKSQCVPAFQYYDRSTGKILTMFEKASAGEVEKQLLEQGEGLIAGGTAYGNIFSGGAAESYLCASTADWGNALKAWNPYSLLVTLILNPFAVIRGVVLCLVEGFLALIDSFKGFMKGQDIFEEWKFIFMRVLVSILMREMITSHARMDIHRGMPVIHVNYFGYDEQAHRRGPSTRFAYWSLSGIDSAIKKLWHAAMRAKRRHYDVWIYSDHGQEKVDPFAKKNGKSIQQAVQEIYETLPTGKSFQDIPYPALRHGYWGDTVLSKRWPNGEKKTDDMTRPIVTTMGPICQIYFPQPYSDEDKKIFAGQLIAKYPAIPLIAVPLASGEVEYETSEGTYRLPQDEKTLLGSDHPYLEAVAKDLESLCRLAHRGDLILFGWRSGAQAISYSNENGAHAGLSPQETQAFALLPRDVPFKKNSEAWIRARDLRQAALVSLGKVKRDRRKAPRSLSGEEHAKFRVMSYNVHSCVGTDRILSVERIARVIAKSDPDIVALQELDAGRRIKGENQAAAIARELEMNFHFHSVCGGESQCFGNAVLSRYPMVMIRAEHLPMLTPSSFFEPRGVLWVDVDFLGKIIHVVNVHLSFWEPELRLQIQKLLGPELLGGKDLGGDVILCGDFNMTPSSKLYRRIKQHFKEPHFSKNGKALRNTWTSQWPIRRIDHIFMRGTLEAEDIALSRTRLENRASDHLPIAADFLFKSISQKKEVVNLRFRLPQVDSASF